MAGKKRKVHWSVKRQQKKNKQEEAGDADNSASNAAKSAEKERVDRRAGFPETIHPGSYAYQRQQQKLANGSNATAGEDAKEAENASFTKRRYGIWVAFSGKDYSGMQL